VRLGADAGVDEVLAESPDRVILATGAERYDAGIAGTVHAWDVLAGADTGRRVTICDWGGDWTGLVLAEQLAQAGHNVRLVTSAIAFGEAVHQYQRNMYLARMDEAGIDLVHHLRLTGWDGSSATFRNVFSEREQVLDGIDTLIVNDGRSACGVGLFAELQDAGADVVRAGDALGPRSFEEAIREGTEAGLAGLGVPVAS
jgi:thioredoxin reductase